MGADESTRERVHDVLELITRGAILVWLAILLNDFVRESLPRILDVAVLAILFASMLLRTYLKVRYSPRQREGDGSDETAPQA